MRGADSIRHRGGNESEGNDADVSHPWLSNRSRRAQPGPLPAAVARPVPEATRPRGPAQTELSRASSHRNFTRR